MPEKKTLQRARRAKAEGKAPTTQAGAFVREEMEHVKKGKHGVKSRKQAIAIGLSKARRSGVKLPRKAGAKASSSRSGGGARRATNSGAGRKSAGGKATGARKSTAARRGATARKGASGRRTSSGRRSTARRKKSR